MPSSKLMVYDQTVCRSRLETVKIENGIGLLTEPKLSEVDRKYLD